MTAQSQRSTDPRIMTVHGLISAENLGTTLPHEHLLVDFVGADRVSRDRYDADEVFAVALPYLERVRKLGLRSFAECTPAYLGRDPRLLQRLSKASGVQILTNTGYYGAAGKKFLPAHAFTETADQLAGRWTREWEEGIEDTGVRPGFIKIGMDKGPIEDVHRNLVRAAARTHKRSGLTIAAHTGDGKAALEEVDILREEGVAPDAWIWVHAQNEQDTAIHTQVAESGGWVSFDGLGPGSLERYVELFGLMKERGFLHRVLVSHDAGWYHVGEPDGGDFRDFDFAFSTFIPELKKAGFTESEIRQLIVTNPREALAIQKRIRG